VVANNVLSLKAFPVATSHGMWMTGGVCECDRPFRYGAVFVRSRMTGAGATQVEMLWPSKGVGPEVDFDETFGGIYQSTATVHFGTDDNQIHRVKAVNMLLWHTWGVVWTPTNIVYTLDGHAWGVVTTPAAIPRVAMSVHLQQQTWCSAHFACPTRPVSTQVAWVARYALVS
jgi:beta-glucanase (GH16 family)